MSDAEQLRSAAKSINEQSTPFPGPSAGRVGSAYEPRRARSKAIVIWLALVF